MKLTPRLVDKIKDQAIDIFKNTQFSAYDPDVQMCLSVIVAFVQTMNRENNANLKLELVKQEVYEPIDS